MSDIIRICRKKVSESEYERRKDMGLLDYIGGKIQQAGAEAQEAQMEAESWDVRKICREIQRTSSIIKYAGYSKTLKAKCQEMSKSELKNTFEDAFYSGNTKACSAMMSVMEERGLAYRDENGRIIRKY